VVEAIIRIGARLGGPGRLFGFMRLFPRGAREWLYRRIAHNRYRFGRTDMCTLPDAELKDRLLE
jgi:predicted DCC family thiol-disulfide oxidoreductase YuxK